MKILTKEERFWAKVRKTETCWLWTASKTRKGYGQFALHGKMVGAHRLSYEWVYGPIPKGLFVDHRCHVHHCVRPDHLRAVTRKQNGENRKGAQANSKTGIRGVYWDTHTGRWRAEFRHNRKRVNVGYFDSVEEAGEAVSIARLKVFTHSPH